MCSNLKAIFGLSFIFTKGLSRSTVKPIQKDKKLKSSNFAKLLCFRNVNIERLKE